MSNKVLVGGILAGVVSFFLGWILYGLLLMDYMKENMNHCASRPDEQMIWWALIASNLILGIFLAKVVDWSGAADAMAGMRNCGVAGLLLALYYDLMFYSFTTVYSNMTAMVVDIVAMTVFFGILGAFLGWFMNRGKPTAAAAS